MYIKLETRNIRLVVKHETSVDRSMSHLPPANRLCEIFFRKKLRSRSGDRHAWLACTPMCEPNIVNVG